MRRFLGWTATVVAVLVLVGLFAGGWYYSDQLLPAPAPDAAVYDVEVVATDADAGTLDLAVDDGDLVRLATLGFETESSLVLLDDATPAAVDGTVRRSGLLLDGDWPTVGALGRAVVAAFPGAPANGLTHDEVVVPGPLGDLPAWRVAGRPDGDLADDGTWAVLVHGRGASRDEVNRSLPILHDLGLPSLVVTVRNDPEAPADPDGWGRFGDTEWEDLHAATSWLAEQAGATRFVLVGYSQGGGIVLSHLRRAPDADAVVAVVGVSPLVSLHDTLVLQAQGRGIPDPVIPPLLLVTKAITDVRSGLDFSRVEHAAAADEFDTPMLLFHGTDDVTVPVGPTRELAERRPDLVTYEEFGDTDHVREWNADRDRFETALRDFLLEHVPAG